MFTETTRDDGELSDSGSESARTGTAIRSQNLDNCFVADTPRSPVDQHVKPGDRSPSALLIKRVMPRRPSAISEEQTISEEAGGELDSASADGEGASPARVAAAAAAAANAVSERRRLERERRQEPASVEPEHQQLGAPPGLSDPASLPSRGSEMHCRGDCSPCVWHWKPQGCFRGTECGYCHICPEGEIKMRKKAKLVTLRSSSRGLPNASEEAFEETEEKAQVSTEDSPSESRQPMPSVGSAFHFTGECRPCAWFWNPRGCQNGEECRHCHLCPEGELKRRRKLKWEAMQKEKQAEKSTKAASPKAKEDPREPMKVATREDAFPPPPGLTEPVALKVADVDVDTPTLSLEPRVALPSVGSAAHSTGECRPCAWFWKAQGCQNGRDCRHCHLCEEGEMRARKKEKAETLRKEEARSPSSFWAQPASLPFVPLMPPPPLPSIGSSMHGTGLCRPCAWFWKPQGCQNGQECCHCHLCSSGEIKARRKVKVAVLRHQGSVELQPELMCQWGSQWAAHKEPYIAF